MMQALVDAWERPWFVPLGWLKNCSKKAHGSYLNRQTLYEKSVSVERLSDFKVRIGSWPNFPVGRA